MQSFQDIVQYDRDICTNCFTRTHETEERNYAVDTYLDDDHSVQLWAREVDLPSRSRPILENTEYMAADKPTAGTFNACTCGCPRGTQRPVTQDTMMTYAKKIISRLEEKGKDVDVDVFLDTVRADTQEPRMQGQQDLTFALALWEARQ